MKYLFTLLSLLLAACGDETAAESAPVINPQEKLTEFFENKRLPNKYWTFKGVSFGADSATASFVIEKGYDVDFAKQADYAIVSRIRSFCPRPADLQRFNANNFKITIVVSGPSAKFPKQEC